MPEITPKYQVQYTYKQEQEILSFLGDLGHIDHRLTMGASGATVNRILVVETCEGKVDCQSGQWIICDNFDNFYIKDKKQ